MPITCLVVQNVCSAGAKIRFQILCLHHEARLPSQLFLGGSSRADCPQYAHGPLKRMRLADTDALEEELKDDIVHKDYMETCIELYEKKKREGVGERVASTGARANTGVQVVATQYQDLEYSKCIGILWPSALYIFFWQVTEQQEDADTHHRGEERERNLASEVSRHLIIM